MFASAVQSGSSSCNPAAAADPLISQRSDAGQRGKRRDGKGEGAPHHRLSATRVESS